MFSASKSFNFLWFLGLICATIHVTSALRCSNCLDPKTCRSSPVAAVDCAEENVSLHHRLLGYQNPGLASASADDSAGFKCFDLKLTYVSALTGSSVLVEQKGCTYGNVDLCTGWDSTAQVARCSTCDSGDECNK